MRRTEAELRAILEGVADAVAAEDLGRAPGLRQRRRGAAARRRGRARDVARDPRRPAARRRVLNGASAEPLVVRHPGEPRWSRVKANPVLEDGGARLAINVIEDITEIKQAEESQRFLAESSRALARSLDLEETLPAVARLVAGNLADACAIHLLEAGELRLVAYAGRADPAVASRTVVEIPVRDGSRGGSRCWAAASTPPWPRTWPCARARRSTTRASSTPARRSPRRSSSRCSRPSCRRSAASRPPRTSGPIGEGIEVGGDFYDLFSTGEGEWFAVMGDVCGKGAEAASVTALARYTIRAAVPRHRSPAGILRWLNDAMLRQQAGRFVTIAIARLQLEPDGTVTVTVACGGHPSPRILRATGLVESSASSGTLLGVLRRGRALRPQRAARGRGRARALHRRADRGQRAATCGRPRTSTPSSRARAGATRRGSSTTSRRGPPRRPPGLRVTTSRCSRFGFSPCCRGRPRRRRSASRRPARRLNLKRASRESRLPTTSSGSVGAHCSPPSTTPTGSVSSRPSSVRKETVTISGASAEPRVAREQPDRGMGDRDADRRRRGRRRRAGRSSDCEPSRIRLVALDDRGATGQRPAAAGLEATVRGRVVPGRIEPRQERPLERLLGTSGGLGRRGGQRERGQRARDDDQGPSHNFGTVP